MAEENKNNKDSQKGKSHTKKNLKYPTENEVLGQFLIILPPALGPIGLHRSYWHTALSVQHKN
jgi:hypothetical protein